MCLEKVKRVKTVFGKFSHDLLSISLHHLLMTFFAHSLRDPIDMREHDMLIDRVFEVILSSQKMIETRDLDMLESNEEEECSKESEEPDD